MIADLIPVPVQVPVTESDLGSSRVTGTPHPQSLESNHLEIDQPRRGETTVKQTSRLYSYLLSTMSGNGGTALLTLTGAALVAASLGLGYMTYANSTESGARSLTDIEDEDEGDFITEEEVVQIFDKLFLEAQNKIAEIMGQIQKMKMIGQNIPDAQIQMFMRQELEESISKKQKALTAQAGIDDICLEEAVWEFIEKGSSKVKTTVERLQRLWQTTTGESVVGWRPGVQQAVEDILSPAETIDAAKVYYDSITAAIKGVVLEYKQSGKDLQSPSVQQDLNLDIAQATTPAAETGLAKVNISQSQFEASVKEHMNNPKVAQALTVLQMQQTREIQGVGA